MTRYRIELLQTAEGVNLKKDRTEDIVIVFLWAENGKKARESADKIALALAVSTHIGMLEYVIESITSIDTHFGKPLTKSEEKMLKKSKEAVRKGRVRRII